MDYDRVIKKSILRGRAPLRLAQIKQRLSGVTPLLESITDPHEHFGIGFVFRNPDVFLQLLLGQLAQTRCIGQPGGVHGPV